MFKIALQIIKTGENILELRLPPVLRIMFLLFTVFIAVSMIYFPIEEGSRGTNYLPVLFLVMAVFVTLYEEKWIFNRKENSIESRLGLLFYFSRETAEINDVNHIMISEVRKGNRNKITSKYYKMSLVFNNETEKDIELVYFREKEKLVRNAVLIADFCSVPIKQ